MPSTHHDLSMISYGLLGLLVVGHEMVGLRATLLLGLSLAAIVLAVSATAALLSHVHKPGSRSSTPSKWVGRHR